ncbi:MAG: efflux RND transporter periplasmic adaptor subunit [Steroidobacteraceae bacterium]
MMTRLAITLPLIAALLLSAACARKDPGGDASSYTEVAVARRDISVSVEAAGVIEPLRTVEVKSKASGEILELNADVGTTVERDALLVKVDPRTPRNRLAQSEAEFKAAQARLANAVTQLGRAKTLLANKWINQADYDKFALDRATAEADLVTQRVNVENARIALEDTEVRAPVAGTIISKRVERGTVISSPTQDVGGGTLLLTMANLDTVRVRVRVDETDVGKLRSGIAASVTVTAFPGRSFAGSIEMIEPQAIVEQNVTQFAVLISLPNKDGLLKPGMNVEAKFDVAKRNGVLAVPVMSLRTDSDLESTAGLLGIAPDELRQQLDRARAELRGEESAPAAAQPQFIDIGGRRVEIPEGTDPDAVRRAIEKRRSGGEPSAEERALLREVFSRMRASSDATSGERGSAFKLGQGLWVVIDIKGQRTARPVEVGVTDLDYVEISAGLAEGDKVLQLPSTSLLKVQENLQNMMQRRGGGVPGITPRPGTSR